MQEECKISKPDVLEDWIPSVTANIVVSRIRFPGI